MSGREHGSRRRDEAGSGVEGVEVAAGVSDIALDVGGFFSGCAGAGAVFDVFEVAEEVFAFAGVVAGAGAEWCGEE